MIRHLNFINECSDIVVYKNSCYTITAKWFLTFFFSISPVYFDNEQPGEWPLLTHLRSVAIQYRIAIQYRNKQLKWGTQYVTVQKYLYIVCIYVYKRKVSLQQDSFSFVIEIHYKYLVFPPCLLLFINIQKTAWEAALKTDSSSF